MSIEIAKLRQQAAILLRDDRTPKGIRAAKMLFATTLPCTLPEAQAHVDEILKQLDAAPAVIAPFDLLPLVPQLLKALPNWVTYESKDNKAPIISGTTQNAQSNNPATWVTYETACENIRAGKGYTGLGFVTDGANSNNLVGFDFDGCRNPETGELTAWAVRMLEVLGQTYGEVTISGTGLRVWVIAPLGKNIKFKMGLAPLYYGKNQVLEIFGDGLYFTMSGNRLSGLPSEVRTLNETQMGEVLAVAHSLAVEAPKPVKERGAFQPEPDEGFRLLFDAIGWKPLIDRMNKMADSRFHNLTIDAGQMMYCPMPGHTPRSTGMKYTPCFGALRDEAGVVHCFGCDFSGDMVKAVFEFDAGEDGGRVVHKNMYDCARAICAEYGLNFEEFFPGKQTAPASPKSEVADDRNLFQGDARKFNPWEYGLQPLMGQRFSGWFPLGRVTLVSGSSGAMKTTFLIQALTSARDGEPLLGHGAGRMPYVFLFADRGRYDCEETFERMGLVSRGRNETSMGGLQQSGSS